MNLPILTTYLLKNVLHILRRSYIWSLLEVKGRVDIMNTSLQALGANYPPTNMAVRNSKSLTMFFFFFRFPFFLIKDGNGYIADEELDALMHDLLANSNQVIALFNNRSHIINRYVNFLLCAQPRSQGSLLPALRSERVGRREPWERGCFVYDINVP